MRRATVLAVCAAAFAVAEIWIIAQVAAAIGIGWTLLALVAIGAGGLALARRRGGKARAALADMRRDPSAVESELTGAALVWLGSLLFLLPGFLTDILGLLCVIPATRPLVRRCLGALGRWATKDLRDRVAVMEAKLDPGSVVAGEAVDDPGRRAPGPDDPTVIRGEIES